MRHVAEMVENQGHLNKFGTRFDREAFREGHVKLGAEPMRHTGKMPGRHTGGPSKVGAVGKLQPGKIGVKSQKTGGVPCLD